VDTRLGIGTVCLLGFVGAVAVMDLRTRRIPNRLTVAAAATAVALAFVRAGWQGAFVSAAGVLIGLLLFLPLCLAGKLGAGDVKAMGAVGAFLGPVGVLLAALYTLLAGGIAAAVALVSFRWRVHRVSDTGQRASLLRQQDLPYGVAIACGTLASIVLR
jgi:prepilin peptidase CpaA